MESFAIVAFLGPQPPPSLLPDSQARPWPAAPHHPAAAAAGRRRPHNGIQARPWRPAASPQIARPLPPRTAAQAPAKCMSFATSVAPRLLHTPEVETLPSPGFRGFAALRLALSGSGCIRTKPSPHSSIYTSPGRGRRPRRPIVRPQLPCLSASSEPPQPRRARPAGARAPARALQQLLWLKGPLHPPRGAHCARVLCKPGFESPTPRASEPPPHRAARRPAAGGRVVLPTRATHVL